MDDFDNDFNNDILISEVKKALQMSISGSAPGSDDLKNEELKVILEDEGALESFTKLFQILWKLEKLPDSLKKSTLILLLKKGDIHEPNNYRPIALLNTILKLYQNIIHNRLYDFLTEKGALSDMQFGFRKDRLIAI